jgi:hypothetical protein
MAENQNDFKPKKFPFAVFEHNCGRLYLYSLLLGDGGSGVRPLFTYYLSAMPSYTR